jgi:tetratricopeptide (TPR) repeat protein
MPIELNLSFPDADHVIVNLDSGNGSGQLSFKTPLTDKDLLDIRWYVETYGAHSLGDPDDEEAGRIAGKLPAWGKKLFDAVFGERDAERLFNRFQDAENDTRLLTISTEHPAILALPWELLHDSSSPDGTFLFHERPSISIRRRVAGAMAGRATFTPIPRDALHLLFVVSRPDDASFLDPRADSLPVLDAIDRHAPGRVTCEFLRPPTLDALMERLGDSAKPAVDILHFDGHGIFDQHGNLPERAAASTTRISRPEELLRDKKTETPPDPDCPPNMGYLLFETPDHRTDFVSAAKLGANLHRHKVALVILSACQSAATAEQENNEEDRAGRPMGSVAARLTATGIPSVLAMTHSVLVHTTRTLFGEFYKDLVRRKGIGEALDNARRYLANHPEKYEVQRGPKRAPLKLHDWFLPALYQQGTDGALLNEAEAGRAEADSDITRSNLPDPPETGFFGRKRTLWEIERRFAGSTRRITLTGFGGQGKTALALEAGRWLSRTGLFRAVVFVDYSRIQADDAVAVAVSNIGAVLGESLIDAAGAAVALKKTPTLVILDNLEALAPESLRPLLDAAVPWSRAGGSRLLCTTRQPDFCHPDYRVEGTNIHRRIRLDGLASRQAPDDALEWCAALMKLPPAPSVAAPKREALIELFDLVKFHPLSLRVLAQQLKTRRPAELGERLEQLLSAAPAAGPASPTEDTPAGLLASLELSLDKLDNDARQTLPRLGVFQGGAFEDDLIAITGLDDAHADERERLENFLAAIEAGKAEEIFQAMEEPMPDEPQLRELVANLREELDQIPPPVADIWPGLRRQLEAAALMEAEDVPGVAVAFLRFHPTLASMLWPRLDAAEQARLSAAHYRRYYALSDYLYQKDSRNPLQARAIARLELPNLLHAVHAALNAGDPDAVEFVEKVNLFLGKFFGLRQEAESLSAKAQAAAGEVGSDAWYLAHSNRGEQLLQAGQVTEAARVFQDILKQLGATPSHKQATTLGRLGRCFRAGGRPDLAVRRAKEAIAVCDRLEPSDWVKRHRGVLLTDMADALRNQGEYGEAREAYLAGLKVDEERNDPRGQGVTLGQLGTLAMDEGDLPEAVERHRAALALFRQLREPAMEAVAWHQLGMVFQKARQWDEAERHYRESARIEEELGNLAGAAQTWNHLAMVSKNAGKPDAAEMWYRKAIEGGRNTGERIGLSKRLNNLASLLQTQPGRLAEARQLAEEALAINKTLDPGAAEIWKTYDLLAEIAEQEAHAVIDADHKAELLAQARDHRRLARETWFNFPGARHELRKHAPLILGVVMALEDGEQRTHAEEALPTLERNGWTSLVPAIRRVLGGERDADLLCDSLDREDAMIISAILQGLSDPSTLADLQPPEPDESA